MLLLVLTLIVVTRSSDYTVNQEFRIKTGLQTPQSVEISSQNGDVFVGGMAMIIQYRSNGKFIRNLTGHTGNVIHVRYSNVLMGIDDKGLVIKWEKNNFTQISNFTLRTPFVGVTSRTGYIAANYGQQIQFIDPEDYSVIKTSHCAFGGYEHVILGFDTGGIIFQATQGNIYERYYVSNSSGKHFPEHTNKFTGIASYDNSPSTILVDSQGKILDAKSDKGFLDTFKMFSNLSTPLVLAEVETGKSDFDIVVVTYNLKSVKAIIRKTGEQQTQIDFECNVKTIDYNGFKKAAILDECGNLAYFTINTNYGGLGVIIIVILVLLVVFVPSIIVLYVWLRRRRIKKQKLNQPSVNPDQNGQDYEAIQETQ